MLRGIFRKAMCDLRARPLQVALLFVVIAAAATTLSLALNVQSSATRPYERLRKESNAADAWIVQLPQDFNAEQLKQMPSVEALSGPYMVSWANYGIRVGDKKQQVALVGMPSQLPELDHPVVTKGRWLADYGTTPEIVVDGGAAKILGLKVGQTIELLAPNGPERFTVVGFSVPQGRAPAPFDDPSFAYVLPETLTRIDPKPATEHGGVGYTYRTGIRLSSPDATDAFFGQALAARMPLDGRAWQDVRQDIKEANQFDVIFLNVFGLFALLAAGLIIANAVSGQVLSQLRDIGILKAIGFTPRQVALSLLAQNLALSVVASLVGVLVGLLIAPFFLERTADVLGVPASAAFNPVLLTIAIAIVTALVALFTLLPAWRAGRIGAIEALNGGNDMGPARTSRLARLASALRLPTVAIVGMKDLWRRPVRTFLTMLALVMAVVTATFSLGIEATFKKTMSNATVIGGPPYQVATDRDLEPDADARRIIEAHPEVESYLVLYWTGARIDRMGFDVRGTEGNLNDPGWRMREGRMPTSGGEAAVSTRLAESLHLKVGDSPSVQFVGAAGPTEVKIVGRYVDAEGGVMTVTRETLPPETEPTDYLMATKPGTDNRALAKQLTEETGGNFDTEVLDETIANIRNSWRPVIFGLNAVLFTIAGVNLLSSLLLNIRERRRDFAILKTVGFTPAQVAQTVFSGSAAMAVIAVMVGLPLGLVATRVMFDVLSSAADIGTGVGAMPGALWLAPLVPGAISVAVLATVVPARRAAAVEVAEALRYE